MAKKGHQDLWLEAAQAKKAGKPYTHKEWNKLLGEYNAIAAHVAAPFAKELIDPADVSNYYTKVIVVADKPTATASLIRSVGTFFTDNILPIFDSRGLGILAQVQESTHDACSATNAIRSFVTGHGQKLLEMTDFDAAAICSLLDVAAPKGVAEGAESVQLVQTRYISDRVGVHDIHPATEALIALAVFLSTLTIGFFFGLLYSLSIPAILAGLLYIDMPVTTTVKVPQPPTPAPKVYLPPHLAKAARVAAKPAEPLIPLPSKTLPPGPKRAQPRAAHPRKGPQAPVRRVPAVLKGWGNVEDTIREGDAQAVRDRAERAKAMEGKPLGAWTEKHGARYAKAVKEE